MVECVYGGAGFAFEVLARAQLMLRIFLLSFASGVDTFHPPNGHKGLEGLRNCKGTWHSRHVHMTKQSQLTFHGHHFKAILGFIMHGYSPR